MVADGWTEADIGAVLKLVRSKRWTATTLSDREGQLKRCREEIRQHRLVEAVLNDTVPWLAPLMKQGLSQDSFAGAAGYCRQLQRALEGLAPEIGGLSDRLCETYYSAAAAAWASDKAASPAELAGYYAQWRHHIEAGLSPLEIGIPWINYPAVNFLSARIDASSRVFEYGCGGSTVFFARRAQSVASVEHDPGFAQLTAEALAKNGLSNAEIQCFPPQPGSGPTAPDPADPDSFFSEDETFRGQSFEAYVKHIDRYPDGHFGMVLVDGRARPACLARSIHKVAEGGLLILDNSERAYYRERVDRLLMENGFAVVLEVCGPVPCFSAGFAQTTIWEKRCVARA